MFSVSPDAATWPAMPTRMGTRTSLEKQGEVVCFQSSSGSRVGARARKVTRAVCATVVHEFGLWLGGNALQPHDAFGAARIGDRMACFGCFLHSRREVPRWGCAHEWASWVERAIAVREREAWA